MKNYLFSAGFIMTCITAHAQGVGIGTTQPAASSMLDITSTTKGFLAPRMTSTQRTNISSPAAGLQVYDTTTNTLWYFNGTVWVNGGATSSGGDNLGNHEATQALVLNGNPLKLRGDTDSDNKLVYNSTAGGPLLTGLSGGTLGISDTANSASRDVLTWKNTGNVGIGTTTPATFLHIAKDKADYGDIAQLAVSGAADPNKRLALGYNTTDNTGFIQSVQSGTVWTDLYMQVGGGNVGIGAYGGSTTNKPGSKLEVDGASTNKTAYNAGNGTTIDYSKSNLAYTTANPGAFTLNGIKDGGTYTLSVRGTSSGTSTFSASGFTVKYANNRSTLGGKETVYTFLAIGTTIYVYTATGF